MQQGDYTSASYYQYPQPPTPTATHHQPPPSYASAPPFSSTNYPPPQPTSDFSSFPSSYPSYLQIPGPLPTAPDCTPAPPPPPPPPPQPQQPQFAPQFPQFESHAAYQPPPQSYSPYPSFDQHAPTPNYAPPTNPNPNPNPNSPYPSIYPSQFAQSSSPAPPYYDNLHDNTPKFDQSPGFYDEAPQKYGDYDRYGNDGVYAYQGSKVEPYGARGTAPKSSTWSSFDDFGRPIGFSSNKDRSGSGSGSSTKVVRAVPKAETVQDVKGGVQKFRVKLLAESYGQSTMDVLCQVGLDGIRMLDPSTSRTLRIYPLDTITRCEVTESSVFAFWSKSSVDIEPKRIRLQSNGYTTNTILDTVTAATVQFKEMGGRIRAAESPKKAEQPPERKKGFADWINLIKSVDEEKDHWVPDEAISKCTACGTDFNAFVRKHHCRNCGDIFCDKCTHGRIALTSDENAPVVRVCDRCMGEVSRRLSNTKESANRSAGLQSHEDLAKKLQEEMERNRKSSSVSRSDGSSRRMKEVACPTCTVHLQVQVPSSGSETIECGVCQHPFLVSAH